MPRRDPQTGKFVSGGEGRHEIVTATLNSTVPAADLSGNGSEASTGDESEVVDWTPVLGNNEVFILEELRGRATLALPATATAESACMLEYALSRDFGAPAVTESGGFWAGAGGVEREVGIIDISQGQMDDRAELHVSHLSAEASHSDTVNALAGGADIDREDLEFYWSGDERPVFDRDDELVIPHQFHWKNISDHAIDAKWSLLLSGRVRED